MNIFKIIMKKTVFNYIKTSRGQAKYRELESNKTFLGRARLMWFVVIASIKDWNIKV